MKIINTVRFNDISVEAGERMNGDTQPDIKKYVLHKIKYIRVKMRV